MRSNSVTRQVSFKKTKIGQFTYIFYGSSHQELLRRKPRIKVLPEWSSFWYVGYLVFWAKMVAIELWKGAFILRQFHKLQFCTAKLAKHRWAAGEQLWLCKSSLYLKHISKALLMHVFIQFRLLYKLELHNLWLCTFLWGVKHLQFTSFLKTTNYINTRKSLPYVF